MPDRRLKGLTITHKFLVFLCFIFVVAAVDSFIFIKNSRKIEAYDDLNFRLNEAKFSMINLEYMLDMFVVARHFEEGKLTTLAADIPKVDKSIRDLEAVGYTRFADNVPVSSAIKYLASDWQSIKSEFERLSSAHNYDHVLLVHNSVDMNTFLFSEKTEKLLDDIEASRRGVFKNIELMVTVTLIASLVVVFGASLVFMRIAFAPLGRVKDLAERVIAGETSVEFPASVTGEVAAIAAAFRKMLSDASALRSGLEKEGARLRGEIDDYRKQFAALREMALTVGGSFSRGELFTAAINGAIMNAGADAAAIYVAGEDGSFMIEASSGLGDRKAADVSVVPYGERVFFPGGGGDVKSIDSFPEVRFKSFMSALGFSSAAVSAIPYNKKTIGAVVLLFKDRASFIASSSGYLSALSSLLGTAVGHIGFFREEYEKRSLLERVIEQSPLGLAVFDSSGAAILLNDALKTMMGAACDADFMRRYRLFEDNILEGAGALNRIKASLDGAVGEVVVDYDPRRLTWCDFTGNQLRLRIKSYPLYDPAGGVSGLILLYEGMAGSALLSEPMRLLRSVK
jgi:HAMP domain-containing protein